MQNLITQIRETLPFDAPEAEMCANNDCRGCSKKLLEYLAMELDSRQADLGRGLIPTFGDLKKLGDAARKVHKVIERNGL